MHADVCLSAFRVSCFRAQRNEILNCRSFIYTFLSHIFCSIAGIFNENALDYLITQLINLFVNVSILNFHIIKYSDANPHLLSSSGLAKLFCAPPKVFIALPLNFNSSSLIHTLVHTNVYYRYFILGNLQRISQFLGHFRPISHPFKI